MADATKKSGIDRRTFLTGVAGVAGLAVTALAVKDAAGGGTGGGPRNNLTLIAPASPGGGWDLVAREQQQVLRGTGIVNNVQVVNIPGAGGTIGLGQVADMAGEDSTLLVTGTVMIGAIINNRSDVDLTAVTPIARLADDYEVFVVMADSPFQTINDLMEAWKADPRGTAVGGGSAGGTDQLLAGMVAKEVGIDPKQVNYLAYSGGSGVVTALLSETVKVGVSGYNEFADQIESGNMRALGLCAEKPVPGIDIVTLKEQGVTSVLTNWRGLMAPPGLSEEQRQVLTQIVTDSVESVEWKDTLARNRWENTFMKDSEFADFLTAEIERIGVIAADLGFGQ